MADFIKWVPRQRPMLSFVRDGRPQAGLRVPGESRIVGLPPPDLSDQSRLGNQNDQVQIEMFDRRRLNDTLQTLFVTQSYQFEHSILRQPSVIAAVIGHGGPVSDLLSRFPPKQKISLRINGKLQQVGETDGYEVEGSSNGTNVTIHARDVLAPLHDGFVSADQNLAGMTYINLVAHAFLQVGRPTLIVGDAQAGKPVGHNVALLVTHPDNERISLERNQDGSYSKSVQAKMGVRWFQVVNQVLSHAGMFMWADEAGRIIIKQPDVYAKASYEIVRAKGRNDIVSYRYKNLTTPRFSHVVIYSRTGGRYAGRSKVKGRFNDQEMIDFGYRRTLTIKDNIASNLAEAEAYASRKLAEGRRAGWGLVYTVAGHTTPSLQNKARVVWRPDTVVRVFDTELGINDLFYIESCNFSRPPTLTTLTLLRIDDVLFGAGVAGG